MPDGWEVLRVLESLHSRVNVLESHTLMDTEGGYEDHDALLLALNTPLLFQLYWLFHPSHKTPPSIAGVLHGKWGIDDMRGDWSIDDACLQDTIWGHGEVNGDKWDFIIQVSTENMDAIIEKASMVSMLNKGDPEEIMNDLRALSVQKIHSNLENKFDLIIFDPSVAKVKVEDISVGTMEDIIGELNKLFSPEEMEED